MFVNNNHVEQTHLNSPKVCDAAPAQNMSRHTVIIRASLTGPRARDGSMASVWPPKKLSVREARPRRSTRGGASAGCDRQ